MIRDTSHSNQILLLTNSLFTWLAILTSNCVVIEKNMVAAGKKNFQQFFYHFYMHLYMGSWRENISVVVLTSGSMTQGPPIDRQLLHKTQVV